MKKVLFLLVIMFTLFFDSSVYAICGTEHINRLKELAKNVDISYEHNVYGDPNDEEGFMTSVYTISVTGINEELMVVDDSGNRYYSYNAVDGIINIYASAGKRNVYIYSFYCSDDLLETRTLNLPVFNFNSLNEECKKDEFKDLDICSEYIEDDKEEINSEEFKEEIERVEEERKTLLYKIKEFFKENALIGLVFIIALVVVVVIISFRYYKRSVLE